MSQIVLVDRCLKYQIQWNKGWLGLSLQRQMELLLKLQSGIHSRGIQYSLLYEALAPEWWTLGEVTTYCGSESASERTISGNIGQNSFLFDWTSPVVSNLHCIGILNITFMKTSCVIIFKRALQWGKDAWRCIPQKNIATLRKAFIGKKIFLMKRFIKGRRNKGRVPEDPIP